MEEKKSVLIVDDDPAIRNMLHECFSADGHACKAACSGIEALGILKQNAFDFMITDVIMPGVDGFKLTREASISYPNMAVIVMTGFDESDTYNKAIDAGADDFIIKPFRYNELIVRVERVCRELTVRNQEKEMQEMSREIIAGLQDEASERIAHLQGEIEKLHGKVTGG